jgi:hypothetical protein
MMSKGFGVKKGWLVGAPHGVGPQAMVLLGGRETLSYPIMRRATQWLP